MNMAQKIEIVRGTTNTFDITVRDTDGNEYTLADGEKVVFGIKRKLDDSKAIFAKTTTSGKDGVYTVTIEPADTEDLDPGRYFYDVGLLSGTQYYNVVKHKPFIIRANVTSRGDGV